MSMSDYKAMDACMIICDINDDTFCQLLLREIATI